MRYRLNVSPFSPHTQKAFRPVSTYTLNEIPPHQSQQVTEKFEVQPLVGVFQITSNFYVRENVCIYAVYPLPALCTRAGQQALRGDVENFLSVMSSDKNLVFRDTKNNTDTVQYRSLHYVEMQFYTSLNKCISTPH